MTPEGKIQAKIMKFLWSLHECWRAKVMEASERGVPDILCCYKGKFYAFEVKTPEGKTSAVQRVQGAMINVAGGQWHVVTSVDQVKEILGCH
jgi:hypothetical protein